MRITHLLPWIKKDILLSNLTTFRIGGIGDYLAEISSIKELKETIQWAREYSLSIFILGAGSNVLIPDEGLRGVIIKLKNDEIKEIKDNSVLVGAGMYGVEFLQKCVLYNWSGFEWLSGIPGTLGGAVYGNAGAFGHSMGERVIRVKTIDKKTLQPKIYLTSECNFAYRDSIFKRKEEIIWEIELKIEKGNKEEIRKKIRENLNYKVQKGFFSFPSAGSIFKNVVIQNTPYAQYYSPSKNEVLIKGERVLVKGGKVSAGWFIERCGLKGKKYGGAQIADFHANVIINKNNAKARDVLYLINLMREKVKEKFKINLEEEVIILQNTKN